MFIETLDQILRRQNPIESNLTITRLQLTRSEFKSLKMIQSKKKILADKSPERNDLMACTTNSLSTSDSVKFTRIQASLHNEQQLPQSDINSKKNIKQNKSNLLRQTFGNFRVFKNYPNTIKSTFQLSNNEKVCIQSPILFNISSQAPMILERSKRPEKKVHSLSQSQRPKRVVLPPREQRPLIMKRALPAVSSADDQTRLPTLESKLSIQLTQTQQKSPLTTMLMAKTFQQKQPLSKSYLELDIQCTRLFRNNKPLLKGDRFIKCRKIPILYLTAERVCVIDSNNLELIYSDSAKDQQPIEIASLTKVVTALLSILICQRYGLDYKTHKCRVSDEAAFMPGTSAQLQVGDTLTVEDLLYALMLPSGNDASVALADNLGRVIIKYKKKPCKISPVKIFVNHMNILYKQIVGDDSAILSSDSEQQIIHLFQNPSGLSFNPNTTRPEQITLFAAIAYHNEIFRTVVNTKEYQMIIQNDRYGMQRKISWKNTNKLLWKGWEGIKTGTTQNAGPCYLGKVDNYIVGVFNCMNQSRRFSEAVAVIQMIRKALG